MDYSIVLRGKRFPQRLWYNDLDRDYVLDSICLFCYCTYVIYFDDFTGFLAELALCKCSLAAFSTRGWNTCSANSSLVILAGCFFDRAFLMVTL